jgi:hypothetical protein
MNSTIECQTNEIDRLGKRVKSLEVIVHAELINKKMVAQTGQGWI